MDQVTGLIPESLSAFVNSRDFRTVQLRDTEGEPARIDYFRRYARENFFDALVPGMGTEEILDLFQRLGGGRWLDLGSGPSTFLWTCAMGRVEAITAVDIVPEALIVLNELRSAAWSPTCYRDVLRRFGRLDGHLAEMYASPLECLAFDFTQPWPIPALDYQFDFMSAIGSFGLSSDPEVFKTCIANCAPFLRHAGILIGANWLRSEQSLLRDGYDTRFLTKNFVASALRDHGIQTIEAKVVPVRGSERYSGLLVWAGRRNEKRFEGR